MGSNAFNYNEIKCFHLSLIEKEPNVRYLGAGLACYDALRDAIGMADDQLGELFKAFGRCSGFNEVPEDIGNVCNALFDEFARVAVFPAALDEQFSLTDDLSKYRCCARNVSLMLTICYLVHAYTCGHPIAIAILQHCSCDHDKEPGGCFSIKKVSIGMRSL